MVKQFKIFVLLILITSCTSQKKTDVHIELTNTDAHMELTNKVLEREILEYSKYIDSITTTRPYILLVNISEVNDSTVQYHISCDIDGGIVKMRPYHFICKVGNKNVFFTLGAKALNENSGFFKMKENAYADFLRKYFPHEYETYKKLKTAKKGEFVKVTIVCFEPETCFLTFVNGKLVTKYMTTNFS